MQTGVFEGHGDYVDALRQAILAACAQDSRELFWLDASFVDWPLSEPAVLDALTMWVRSSRRLHLLALQYDDLCRRHPRFVQWRTRFSHCISARAYEPEAGGREGLAAAMFNVGGESSVSLRLFDVQQWRGACSLELADTLRTREWFDALTQRSSESFAATTLGL
jgi:hypothetical protein